MGKRGFTLVEVMAVLVILCLIMLMGVPAITRTLKKQEDNAVKQYKNNLCIGAKNYARHNSIHYEKLYENKGSTTVCSNILYTEGYISSTLKHPNTNGKEEHIKINMEYNGGKIKCTIDVDNLSGC